MVRSRSEGETKEIGREIGKRLKPGDIVCLSGELGSGKTIMVKGIASSLGIHERDITSPSFTIISEHSGSFPLYHIDLYRLDSNGISQLGLEEYLYGKGIAVIEWAERANRAMPRECVRIKISYAGDTERDIHIEGIDLNDPGLNKTRL